MHDGSGGHLDRMRLEEAVLDRLYDVVVDPSRFEDLMEDWERLMAPAHRGDRQAAEIASSTFATHFRRVAALLDKAAATEPGDRMLTAAQSEVDRFPHVPAVAYDPSQKVIAINRAAEALLTLRPGTRLAELDLPEDIRSRVDGLFRTLLRGRSRGPEMLRLQGHDGRQYLTQGTRVDPGDGPPFILLVTSILFWPAGLEDRLRSIFGLSQAEAEILRALTESRNIKEIAENRGRSVETVRGQIKSLLQKTDCHSQSDLVMLALSAMEIQNDCHARRIVMPMKEPQAPAPDGRRYSGAGRETISCLPFRKLMRTDLRGLDYLEFGAPHGRPVLYLHGNFGLCRWTAAAEAMAERLGLRIIVPIRPGYGRSDPLPMGVDRKTTVAEDCLALLDHLGVEGCVILSMVEDVRFAARIHALAPQRVAALVASSGTLPASTPQIYDQMGKWHRFMLGGAHYTPKLLPFMVRTGFAMARKIGKRKLIEAIYGAAIPDRKLAQDPLVFEALDAGTEITLSDRFDAAEAFTRDMLDDHATDWSEEIDRLKGQIPVHFLHGDQDLQVPHGVREMMQARFPWIEFHLYPDTGQLLFFQRWKEVLTLVERFCGQLK